MRNFICLAFCVVFGFCILAMSCEKPKPGQIVSGPIWNRANGSNTVNFGIPVYRTVGDDNPSPDDDPPRLLIGPDDCPVFTQWESPSKYDFYNPCAICHCDSTNRFTDGWCYDADGELVQWENRKTEIFYKNMLGTTWWN